MSSHQIDRNIRTCTYLTLLLMGGYTLILTYLILKLCFNKPANGLYSFLPANFYSASEYKNTG